MVKGTVKTNKANETKYIYLPKDCGFVDGQEVDIKNSGFGIYQESDLKKYFEDNVTLFNNVKNELIKIRKELWEDKFFEIAEIIGDTLGYGKFEWDEAFYFEKNNDYTAEPFGDIDGGDFYDLTFRTEEIKQRIKDSNKKPEDVKKDLVAYLAIELLKREAEELVEQQHQREKNALLELGFENVKDSLYDAETTIYTNGLVHIWYNAEDFAYNTKLNITTMREVKMFSEEPK